MNEIKTAPQVIKDNKETLIKAGKKPLSSKPKMQDLAYDDMFGNNLALDPELQKELDEKGLVPRWVDAKRLFEMNGFNDKGWRTYRRENRSSDTINTLDFKFGNDPTGIIRRGSLILAVKSKEQADKHRMFLNERTDKQAQINTKSAEQLRAFAKSNGLDAKIYEGYEDNE